MPTRELLTPTQRLPFLGIPPDLDERAITRLSTFTAPDLARIRQHRRDWNRLGFAVQLACLRYPGIAWEPTMPLPMPVLTFIAAQVGAPPATLADYALRDPTRREHLAEIIQAYGYQTFSVTAYRELAAWLMPLALSTDRGLTLVEALVAEVRTRQLVRPALSTLERLAWETRKRAQQQIYTTLAGALTTTQREQMDALLQVSPPKKQTNLLWLREPPGPTKPAALLRVLLRIQFIRGFGLDVGIRHQVHAQQLRQLAREGEKYTPQFFVRFTELRRYATLSAFLLETLAQLTDTALEMHDRIIGQLFSHGRRAHLEQFAQKGKDINKTVRLYARVGKALIQAHDEGGDAYTALESVLPWTDYVVSVDDAATLARPADFDYLDLLDNSYEQLRKYVPDLLATMTFHAVSASQPVVDALTLIHTLGARKQVPKTAPTRFIKARWAPYVFTEKGMNRHYYEMCALTELRNGLRSGDIWAEGSQQYREFDTYLLTPQEWHTLRDAEQAPLAVPTTCAAYLTERRERMAEQLAIVARLMEANQLPGVRMDKKKAHITPLDPDVPAGVDEVTRLAYAKVRRIKIADLLAEVDALTHFSRHFTHLHSQDVLDDRVALFADLLAEATNLGLAKMADATPGLTFRQLAWVADWYIRDECSTKALAEIVNQQHQLVFASHWGDGTTSSSDGQRFPVGGRKSTAAQVNAKYGTEPSIVFATHISDH